MPVIIYVLIEMLLQYVTLVNVTQYKYKVFELVAAWSAACLIAVVAARLGWYEIFSNLGTVVVFTAFLFVKTRNITLSVLFSSVTAVIGMTANQVAEPLVSSFIKHETAGFALTQALTVLVSFTVGRLLKKRLGDIARSNPKGGAVRFIIGGTVMTLGLFYANVFLPESLSRAQSLTVVAALLAGYTVFLIAAAHAFISGRNASDEMENLKNYTAQIEEMYTELRHFRHDYVNILSTIYGYAQNNDMENLRGYLLDRVMPYNRGLVQTGASVDRLINVKLPELKGLLSLKMFHAQRLNVDMRVEIASPVEHAGMDMMDLCRVLGVLLDNAVEASEGKKIKNAVRFMAAEDNYGLTFILANKTDDPPDLNEMFKRGYSTKGKGHGLGLYNLRAIVGKYPNAGITVKIENGEVIFELIVGN